MPFLEAPPNASVEDRVAAGKRASHHIPVFFTQSRGIAVLAIFAVIALSVVPAIIFGKTTPGTGFLHQQGSRILDDLKMDKFDGAIKVTVNSYRHAARLSMQYINIQHAGNLVNICILSSAGSS